MTLSQQLAEFCHDLAFDALPRTVVDRAKDLLLDFAGVALRGSREPSSEPVYRALSQASPSGPCTVIGRPERASPPWAALANGAAAHAIEMDDIHQAGSIHLGVVVFPAAIAVAEAFGPTSSRALITAVVAGYEVAARIAMAVQPKEHYALGFHPTATCGAFGAAAVSAKLLDLDIERTAAAFGIVGSMAAGSLEFLSDGSWTKRLHAGLAAKNGLEAALLAAHGFSGPAAILEGRDGFLNSHSRRPDLAAIRDGLGETFEILETGIKPHACCRYMQGPIDAILHLRAQHRDRLEEITGIEVAVLEAGWDLVCEPRALKYHPKTTVDAQFSMPFGAAVAWLYGRAGVDEFAQAHIQSRAVRAVMGAVTLTKDIRIEKGFPRQWRAHAAFQLDDGTQLEHWVEYPKGDPANPLTPAELGDKFRFLAGAVMSEARIRELETAILTLDRCADSTALWRMLGA